MSESKPWYRKVAGAFWKFPAEQETVSSDGDSFDDPNAGHPYRELDPELMARSEKNSINETELKRLGLEKAEVPSYPEAQRLINEVIDGIIDINSPIGREQFVTQWQTAFPPPDGLPMPCVPDKDDYWYLSKLSAEIKDKAGKVIDKNRIVSSLLDHSKKALPNYSQTEEIWFDSWIEEDWIEKNHPTDSKSKLQQTISPLLRALLNDNNWEGVVNISREKIDQALWDGDPANRQPTPKHTQLLESLGLDPNEWEFHLIRQDQYARLSKAKGWGEKNVLTMYDYYFFGDGGSRGGLSGGYRAVGGPSGVGGCWRGDARGALAVRLVLSRKQV